MAIQSILYVFQFVMNTNMVDEGGTGLIHTDNFNLNTLMTELDHNFV